jgi:hypothetical protein
MSSELDQAREIAERIARRVGSAPKPNRLGPESEVSSELASVRAGINDLQRKIAKLEARLTSPSAGRTERIDSGAGLQQRPAPSTHSPWLAGINSSYAHPSQEKFGVEEATVSELVDYVEKEKLCSVEPGGKPCDHCAMCSSRGF